MLGAAVSFRSGQIYMIDAEFAESTLRIFHENGSKTYPYLGQGPDSQGAISILIHAENIFKSHPFPNYPYFNVINQEAEQCLLLRVGEANEVPISSYV